MKTKFVSILISFLFFSYFQTFSQNVCTVLKQEISGNYEGKCKNGLAHGKGISIGTDKYEGEFKEGLPNGNGVYTWATGEVYNGLWKDGKRNGKGRYTYKVDGVDSIKNGIWKNDTFYKKIAPAEYNIIRSNSIARSSVKRIGDGNSVIISFMQGGNTNPSISNLRITSTSGTDYTISRSHGYEDVVFPVTIKANYMTLNQLQSANIEAEFVVEIKDSGAWEIVLNN